MSITAVAAKSMAAVAEFGLFTAGFGKPILRCFLFLERETNGSEAVLAAVRKNALQSEVATQSPGPRSEVPVELLDLVVRSLMASCRSLHCQDGAAVIVFVFIVRAPPMRDVRSH